MGHCKLVQIPDPWIEGLYYHRPNYIQPPYLLNNSPKSYQHCCTLNKVVCERAIHTQLHKVTSLTLPCLWHRRGKPGPRAQMQHPGMALTTTVSSAPRRPGGREGRREGREGGKKEEKETVPQRTGHGSSQVHSYQQVRVTICVLEMVGAELQIIFII